MAIGDDAIAAGMADVNGATTPANTIDTELMLTRDYIAQGKGSTDAATAGKVVKRDATGRAKFADPSAAADAATKGYVDNRVVPLNKGGTGATTAAAARTALGVVAASITVQSNGAYDVGLVWTGAQMQLFIDGNFAGIVNLGGGDYVLKSGDTMTGNLFLPNSTAAVSGYTVAYIDGNGRVSRGASTERVKKHISPIDPALLGAVFPDLFRFQMRLGDGSWKFGYIAERLAESEALRPFVVWETEADGKTLALDGNGNPIPLSIDFISLLIVQVAQLNQRVTALEVAQ